MNTRYKHTGRAHLISSLAIILFDYFDLQKLRSYPVKVASLEDLLVFHCKEYVEFIANSTLDKEEEFGYGTLCPIYPK